MLAAGAFANQCFAFLGSNLAELYCIISQDQELVPDGHNLLVTNDKPFFFISLEVLCANS